MPSVIPKLQPDDIAKMQVATMSIEEILLRSAHFPATERALIKLQRALELETQNIAEKPPRRR
jgi:DNA-binding GntR family transcriptional regulator